MKWGQVQYSTVQYSAVLQYITAGVRRAIPGAVLEGRAGGLAGLQGLSGQAGSHSLLYIVYVYSRLYLKIGIRGMLGMLF